MPQLLPLFILNEIELGATIEEVAAALGVTTDLIRERVEAARLCFRRQVRVVAVASQGR